MNPKPSPASTSPSAGSTSGQPVAVVVGASSGMGAAVARRLVLEGKSVAYLARREAELQREVELANQAASGQPGSAHAYIHDAADLDSIPAMLQRIESELGPVQELFYLAGVMPEVEQDEFDTGKDGLQMQVNAVGCIAWCNAVIPGMLSRKAGHIVGVTSVAQDRGRVGKPGYHASKAAMDTFLESMRNRVWRHGVKVTTVRPGFVLTPMTEALELKGAITADAAAKAILKARSRGRTIVYVPFKWRPIMFVIRNIPSFVFRKLDI